MRNQYNSGHPADPHDANRRSIAFSRSEAARLALIANARRSLAQATDLGEVRQIMSKADALQHYFRKVGDSFEAQQAARRSLHPGEAAGRGVAGRHR